MDTSASASAKRRTPRKPKATKLPPALAHELDVVRAARMGIDISYMAPDERCMYPSKFCCNIRARKSTGKLHRFCEDHRSRANVNQKRWNHVRRCQGLVASAARSTDCESMKPDQTLPTVDNDQTESGSSLPAPNAIHTHHIPANELSDDEIDALIVVLLNDERAGSSRMPKTDEIPINSLAALSYTESHLSTLGQPEPAMMYTL